MTAVVAAVVPLCFLDTETDSVRPDRQIWEVGAVRREPDGREVEYHAFLPIDLARADPFALRVGRFFERHPYGRYASRLDASCPDPARDLFPADVVAAAVSQMTHGAHIIGAVPNFDTEGLDRLLRAHRLLPGWHYHLGDVENLAVGFLAGRGQPIPPPWSSRELGEALGVDPAADDEKHTALGDVRWAMRMYDAVMSGGPA